MLIHYNIVFFLYLLLLSAQPDASGKETSNHYITRHCAYENERYASVEHKRVDGARCEPCPAPKSSLFRSQGRMRREPKEGQKNEGLFDCIAYSAIAAKSKASPFATILYRRESSGLFALLLCFSLELSMQVKL